jgi:ethanolamine ammonia-lyase small subunit
LQGSTQARIALGRAGGSLPTSEWLAFKAAHAAARDAVHNEFNAEQLADEVRRLETKALIVSSGAADRMTYLQQPVLGRRLGESSRELLLTVAHAEPSCDLAIVISDGLSALAAHRQAVPLLGELLPRLKGPRWRLAPVIVARFARVALQDEVGAILGAELALILVGERPGLASPDSLGVYLVYGPRVGNTDAQRNCVSNIRPNGMSWTAAADTICYLLNEARRQKLSGVQLKDQRALVGALPAMLAKDND